MHAKVHDAIKGVPKIVTWDQSLLTVKINTITRWVRKGTPNVDCNCLRQPPS